jgi:hypothetical protein
MEVYNIRSQFAGMCQMSKEDDKKDQQAMKEAQQSKDKGKRGGKGAGEDDEEGRGALAGSRQPEGIGLNFFKKHCSFLAGCQDEIIQRILVAQGLDIASTNTVIDWQTYLDLYCIFEAGLTDKKHLRSFWIKFFDNNMRG